MGPTTLTCLAASVGRKQKGRAFLAKRLYHCTYIMGRPGVSRPLERELLSADRALSARPAVSWHRPRAPGTSVGTSARVGRWRPEGCAPGPTANACGRTAGSTKHRASAFASGCSARGLTPPPSLAGGYYLTSAYGALSLIKNFQEEQAARLLSSETRDTLRQWHKRRTTNRTVPSVDDFQVCGLQGRWGRCAVSSILQEGRAGGPTQLRAPRVPLWSDHPAEEVF